MHSEQTRIEGLLLATLVTILTIALIFASLAEPGEGIGDVDLRSPYASGKAFPFKLSLLN